MLPARPLVCGSNPGHKGSFYVYQCARHQPIANFFDRLSAELMDPSPRQMQDTPIAQQQFLLSPRQESVRQEQDPAPDFGRQMPTDDDRIFAEYQDTGRQYEPPYDISPQTLRTPIIQAVRTRYFGPGGDAGAQPSRDGGSIAHSPNARRHYRSNDALPLFP